MTRRRSRVLRLRCPCGRNVADVVAGTTEESVQVRHRGRLLSIPNAPTYAWACRCGREHRIRRMRVVGAYLAVPAGSVDVRVLGSDL